MDRNPSGPGRDVRSDGSDCQRTAYRGRKAMAVAHYLAPIVVFICASTPSPSQGAEDVPSIFNLSEVSNDGRIIHNRVTFDCTPESRHSVSCLLIQQDIREPTPPSKDEIDKMIAQLGDPLDMCKQLTAPLGRGEPNHERLFMERARNACAKKDRTELVAAFRDRAEIEGQTCTLLTFVQKHTFEKINNDTWISYPDHQGICDNVSVTRTLRRDPKFHSGWNYTESTVAGPPPAVAPTVCKASSETVSFTWRKAVTAYETTCRYLTM